MKRQMLDNYKATVTSVFATYNLRGFWIQDICCNNKFRPLIDHSAIKFYIKINYTNPQEHIPEAKHNKWLIIKWILETYHYSPNNKFPKLMSQVLVIKSAKKLNFFPANIAFHNTIVQEWFPIKKISHITNIVIVFGTYV